MVAPIDSRSFLHAHYQTIFLEVQRGIDQSTSPTDCGWRPKSFENWPNLEQVRI